MIMYIGSVLTAATMALFAAAPSSTNFTLKTYDIGTGGGTGSSATYGANGVSGSQSGTSSNTSASYTIQPGEPATQNANVPPAPAFTNPGNEYLRLKLVINTGGNPGDAKYAVAISSDAFSTDTRYVQNDDTVGPALGSEDYQTYAGWGSATGVWVTGLASGTTYTVKVKAVGGNFSESSYGPTATAATSNPSLSFSVATSASGTPPFTVTLPSITPGAIATASADPILTVSTNLSLGGSIYIKDTNAGLHSASQSFTLGSASANLTAVSNGYGAYVLSTSQSAGGPLTADAPYSTGGTTVGALSSSLQKLATTSGAVTSGIATVRLKAKTDISVPPAADYSDTLTFIAAMNCRNINNEYRLEMVVRKRL
jgi:hypothetical protein